jgi:hypothetical protein
MIKPNPIKVTLALLLFLCLLDMPYGYYNLVRFLALIGFAILAYKAKEEDQFSKCCYCENTFLDVAFGDVEHYRPKGGYLENIKDKLKKPGYYWMAYSWENLHLSCDICNRTYKKNYFPLKNNVLRISTHHNEHNLNKEEPLLLSPTEDNEIHFEFKKHIIKGLTIEGKTSVIHYGLDRTELNQKRLEWYEMIDTHAFFYNLNPDNISNEQINTLNVAIKKKYTRSTLRELHLRSKRILDNAANKKGKFTLMVRKNFSELPTT